MVGTLKHCIARLAHGDTDGWETKLSREVYGYRRRAMASVVSLYELIYWVNPRLV